MPRRMSSEMSRLISLARALKGRSSKKTRLPPRALQVRDRGTGTRETGDIPTFKPRGSASRSESITVATLWEVQYAADLCHVPDGQVKSRFSTAGVHQRLHPVEAMTCASANSAGTRPAASAENSSSAMFRKNGPTPATPRPPGARVPPGAASRSRLLPGHRQ